jgi:hypothetical protein
VLSRTEEYVEYSQYELFYKYLYGLGSWIKNTNLFNI